MNTASVNAIEEENQSPFISVTRQNVYANPVAPGFSKSDVQFIPDANLFRVMCIVPDNQDFIFVEKVQLIEDGILSLCNKLVPASASALAFFGNPPQNRVNFKALNGLCLSTVGFYGDKKMMIDIFGKQRLLGDSVLSQMEGNKFEPGLYVIVPEEEAGSLIAFYWHEGDQFKEASRKDVSCNFIRYLVELCDCVYICVKEGYDFDALAASAIREPSRSGRHMEIEVQKVKISENDMELLPGFNVGMPGKVKVEEFLPLFCEGYYHCCFLTAEYTTPRTFRRTEEGCVKASEFGNMLDKWSWESYVDYSRMRNENFVNVLQGCHPREYQEVQNKEKEKKIQHKQVLEQFVEELKRNMSKGKKDSLVRRYIEEVTIKDQSTKWTPWSCNKQVELKVKVSIVEERKAAILWKACELTPMRKEMAELINNSEHSIVPRCSKPVELVTINPENERLFKVVVLRSGEMMVFIHNFKHSSLHLYHCPRIGSNIINNGCFTHTFKSQFDLLDIDESTRCMALYEMDKSRIVIYKFDDFFRKAYRTGVDVHLEIFNGSSTITWMHFIPGKMELLLVDETNKARVVEIHEKPRMRAKHISLPWSQPLSKACISADGFFLVAFREFQSSVEGEGDVDVVGDSSERRLPSLGVQLEIFVLGDTMKYLKTVYLNANRSSNICDLKELGMKITNFGSQSHLVLYSHADAPGILSSHVLKTVIAGEVVMPQQVQSGAMEVEDREIDGSCSYLEYVYHIFDKFGTIPALFQEAKRRVTLKVLLQSSTHPCNADACIKYLRALFEKLRRRKEKDFSNFTIDFHVDSLRKWTTEFGRLDSIPANERMKLNMGMWVRLLICLVPLQIARAEKNGVVALKDGLRIPPYINYVDSISLASSIRFGLYDSVLNSWEGKIKVISSMGKQSSGKSYLLNHLSGSLFDVSGGRCTDGVWMTITVREDSEHDHTHMCGDRDCRCLYVLLDFEGLGSLERTEQEDMLLSVVSAALSNLTIFNKKDFHLDRDTESAFNRFQSGINLIKEDEKLFKGQFYIAIKDVDTSDVEDLIEEFNDKICQICSRSEECFITKMYGGKVEIAAMSPYNRSDYYMDSLSQLAGTVKEMDSFYDNGSTFLRDLKLIISHIAAKDWSSIGGKRVALIANIIRTNLVSAISMGCLSAENADDVQGLVNFDTQEEIPDGPIVGDFFCNLRDQGLCLVPSPESSMANGIRDVLSQLKSELENVLSRKGNNGELWHYKFENFLQAVGDRRHDRIQQWISSNTTEFYDNEEVKMLQLKASLALAEMKQGLSVCGRKCSLCFWRCVLEKGHDQSDSAHSCMASHSCTERCSYCFREGDNSSQCGDLAGHEGAHNCKEKNHTCRETCHLVEISCNCNKVCSLRPEHSGRHKCNSPQHVCKTTCSLPGCNSPCAVPIESNHEKHQCHVRYCQSKCTINGCNRTCGVQDHFHDLYPNAEHLCGNEHACPEKCEMPGICEIVTELVRETRIFEGQRGPFEYVHVPEQNGSRKVCCVVIPPFEKNHQGPHVHTKIVDSVHYCETRCEACGYLCQRRVAHSGLHDTVHGNMKNVRFVSEIEDIEIEGREYKWGEKGEAEMCNMYCKKQGRGHIHFVPCLGSEKCTGNRYDDSRHETVKYGPDVDTPKDEMTHETYWHHVEFVDPCTKEELWEFNLCNQYCNHKDHKEGAGVSDKSYCTKKLWHSPLIRSAHSKSSSGYVTDDGHHFVCSHAENAPHHVIFVIDKSRSMGKPDIIPTMAKFNTHNCRLGCVYEAIHRFIEIRLRRVCTDSISVVLFDKSATVAIAIEDMKENVVDSLLRYRPAEFTDIHWREAMAAGAKVAQIGLELVTGMGTGIGCLGSLVQSTAQIPGWGTHFSSGLDAAKKLMNKAGKDPSVKHKPPFLIFLSDGENNGGEDPVDRVRKMRGDERRMKLHTILYGSETKTNIMKEMATAGDGNFHHTLDQIELVRSFEDLAQTLRTQAAGFIHAK